MEGKEEEKGTQILSQTKTTDQLIKELEEALNGVKLNYDDKEKLRTIFDNITEKEE